MKILPKNNRLWIFILSVFLTCLTSFLCFSVSYKIIIWLVKFQIALQENLDWTLSECDHPHVYYPHLIRCHSSKLIDLIWLLGFFLGIIFHHHHLQELKQFMHPKVNMAWLAWLHLFKKKLVSNCLLLFLSFHLYFFS